MNSFANVLSNIANTLLAESKLIQGEAQVMDIRSQNSNSDLSGSAQPSPSETPHEFDLSDPGMLSGLTVTSEAQLSLATFLTTPVVTSSGIDYNAVDLCSRIITAGLQIMPQIALSTDSAAKSNSVTLLLPPVSSQTPSGAVASLQASGTDIPTKKEETPKEKKSTARKARTKLTPEQILKLNEKFAESRCCPRGSQLEKFASELNLEEAVIKVWFQNKKAKIKSKNKLASGSSSNSGVVPSIKQNLQKEHDQKTPCLPTNDGWLLVIPSADRKEEVEYIWTPGSEYAFPILKEDLAETAASPEGQVRTKKH